MSTRPELTGVGSGTTCDEEIWPFGGGCRCRRAARFPENGWALYGLLQCLEAEGKTEEAEAVRARLQTAWRAADIELVGSRF